MSTQPPAIDKANIQWEDAKSKNGFDFQTGSVGESADTGVQGGSSAESIVNWPVASPGTWVPTPNLEKHLGISGYELVRSGGVFYSYTLTFRNVGSKHYHYWFTDKTDDTYENKTYKDDFHYINYNSSNPTIVKISAQ